MTRKVLDCFYTAEYVGSSPTLCTEQLGYGVIGSTTAFDAVCSGSSPDTPASNIGVIGSRPIISRAFLGANIVFETLR